jgi:hypothetical protein
MAAVRSRAWRFLHPDFDAAAIPSAPAPPPPAADPTSGAPASGARASDAPPSDAPVSATSAAKGDAGDVMARHGGLVVAQNGAIAMVSEDASVRQAVLLLLTTRPGERIMLPTYGCELHRLAFDPNDDTTAGLAIYYVRRALVRWEPRIEILALDADRSQEDPGRLDISLHYRVRPTLSEQHLVYSLRLTPPEA